MKSLNENILFLYISFIFIFITCNRENNDKIDNIKTANLSKENIEKIKKAKYIEEICQIDTVIIKMPVKDDAGYLKDILFTKDSLIVLSFFKSSSILIFNQSGNLIRRIGRRGAGPGEFVRPWYLNEDQDGHLVIGDFNNRRISFITNQGDFKNSFRIVNEIHGLLLSPEGDVIVHDHMNARLTGSETIHLYNIEGKEFRKFGRVSEMSMKIKNVPFRPPGPYITIDNHYIYEADYPDYRIKKYHYSGNMVKKFGDEPEDWRSVLKADLSKMPNPQTVTPDVMKQLDDFFKNFDQYSITNWITLLKPGVLLQNISKMNNKFGESRFIIHSLEGELLNCGLHFSKYPDAENYPFAQLVPSKPFGFCIYVYSVGSVNHQEKEDILQIPLIVFHSIVL